MMTYLVILRREFLRVFVSFIVFLSNSVLVYSVEKNFWLQRQQSVQKKIQGSSKPFLHKTHTRRLAGLPHALTSASDVLHKMPLARHLPLSSGSNHSIQKTSADGGLLSSLVQAFPRRYGTIREVVKPDSSDHYPIVIHIQDVHMNAEAQANIGKIVQFLMDNDYADIVGLEGAFDEIDIGRFRRYDDQNVICHVADYLLKTHQISGPVHTGLTYRRPGDKDQKPLTPLVGIDHQSHYQSNVQAYKDSMPLQAAYKKIAQERLHQIKSEKLKIFHPALQAFDKEVESYRSGRMSFGEYVKCLGRYIQKEVLAQPVEAFLKALEAESHLDWVQVEKERAKVVEAFVREADEKDLRELLQQSAAFKLGHVRHAAYYQFLKEMCARYEIHLADYVHMNAYIQYVLLADEIDLSALSQAVAALEKRLYRHLSKNDKEKQLVQLDRHLYLIRKLVDFSLSSEEWKEYKARMNNAHLGALTKEPYLKNIGRGLTLTCFESFYENAEKRDKDMSHNLHQAMKRKKAKAGVLVAGGFHAAGIKRTLTEAGVTYVQVTPRVTHLKKGKGSAYLGVFAQEKTPLGKLFAGEKLLTAPHPGRGLAAAEVMGACLSRLVNPLKNVFRELRKLSLNPFPGKADIVREEPGEEIVVRFSREDFGMVESTLCRDEKTGGVSSFQSEVCAPENNETSVNQTPWQMKWKLVVLGLVVLIKAVFFTGCYDLVDIGALDNDAGEDVRDDAGADGDADTDADTDTDADSDADSDTDADADSDTDSDSDTGTGHECGITCDTKCDYEPGSAIQKTPVDEDDAFTRIWFEDRYGTADIPFVYGADAENDEVAQKIIELEEEFGIDFVTEEGVFYRMKDLIVLEKALRSMGSCYYFGLKRIVKRKCPDCGYYSGSTGTITMCAEDNGDMRCKIKTAQHEMIHGVDTIHLGGHFFLELYIESGGQEGHYDNFCDSLHAMKTSREDMAVCAVDAYMNGHKFPDVSERAIEQTEEDVPGIGSILLRKLLLVFQVHTIGHPEYTSAYVYNEEGDDVEAKGNLPVQWHEQCVGDMKQDYLVRVLGIDLYDVYGKPHTVNLKQLFYMLEGLAYLGNSDRSGVTPFMQDLAESLEGQTGEQIQRVFVDKLLDVEPELLRKASRVLIKGHRFQNERKRLVYLMGESKNKAAVSPLIHTLGHVTSNFWPDIIIALDKLDAGNHIQPGSADAREIIRLLQVFHRESVMLRLIDYLSEIQDPDSVRPLRFVAEKRGLSEAVRDRARAVVEEIDSEARVVYKSDQLSVYPAPVGLDIADNPGTSQSLWRQVFEKSYIFSFRQVYISFGHSGQSFGEVAFAYDRSQGKLFVAYDLNDLFLENGNNDPYTGDGVEFSLRLDGKDVAAFSYYFQENDDFIETTNNVSGWIHLKPDSEFDTPNTDQLDQGWFLAAEVALTQEQQIVFENKGGEYELGWNDQYEQGWSNYFSAGGEWPEGNGVLKLAKEEEEEDLSSQAGPGHGWYGAAFVGLLGFEFSDVFASWGSMAFNNGFWVFGMFLLSAVVACVAYLVKGIKETKPVIEKAIMPEAKSFAQLIQLYQTTRDPAAFAENLMAFEGEWKSLGLPHEGWISSKQMLTVWHDQLNASLFWEQVVEQLQNLEMTQSEIERCLREFYVGHMPGRQLVGFDQDPFTVALVESKAEWESVIDLLDVHKEGKGYVQIFVPRQQSDLADEIEDDWQTVLVDFPSDKCAVTRLSVTKLSQLHHWLQSLKSVDVSGMQLRLAFPSRFELDEVPENSFVHQAQVFLLDHVMPHPFRIMELKMIRTLAGQLVRSMA